MVAAGLGLRKSGKCRAKSSTQGWSPNSGQAAEDELGSVADVLVSEQGQHSSSSGLRLPQQSQQAGSQTQSVSAMNQLQNGLGQYQPSGTTPEPPTVHAPGQYQPAGNSETPLAREDLNSDAIVDAQLTHLISGDDAPQGQDAPRDARLEEDAGSGASVHNQPQVNASVLPVICAEYDSHMVKRVYNSGATVKPITTTYMHIVSQIRMQLMQSPANGTPSPEQQRIQKFYSLLLKTRTKPQQQLHLMMSETFLDEKRLFAWMMRSWASSGSNMLHGTASKTCVAQRTSNLPRGSSLPCSKLNMPSFELSSTTTQPLRPQNQSGKRWCLAAGSSWDDLQSMPLRATVPTTWTRGWSFFGLKIGLLFGQWYVLNVMSLQCRTRRRTEKQQMQSRIRKVATLARTGEKGRALAAARNAPPVPVTEQIVQEIKSLYPADPEPPAPASAPISALFLSEVAEQVSTTLRKMPRLSEPGPLGMRAEHWYDFGSLAGNSDLFVQVIAHIAAAAVPNSVLQYLRAGQITPLAKPTRGHRPLLMMSFLRRPALKSVMAAKKESVAKCAGPLQYGVGRPDGANTMIKTIQYLAEADNSRVLVALDLKAAFQNVSRRAMPHSIAQTDTDLAAVFSRWFTGTTEHRMHYDSAYTKITA